MTDQSWTVLRLLDWTTDFFRSRGSESPRLDAELLLAHARSCERIELYTAFDDVPNEEQRIAFREMIKRRGDGAPVAQLVGTKEFFSLSFRVDDNVLIPRPETEHLVVEAIDVVKQWRSQPNPPFEGRPCRILDVGTGSGVIAIALAKHLDDVDIVAVDISPAALEIALWNAKHHQVENQVRFYQSDLLESLTDETPFDLICSNPPYVSREEYEELPNSVRSFEPQLALLAGKKGTETIERIFDEAPSLLHPHGCLIIEHSPMNADHVKSYADHHGAYAEAHLIKDLAGHKRLCRVFKK
ncbi:MAG: peptide chain release factor N(5)-glutamine methyltransferase [Planctomycetota bacterium]